MRDTDATVDPESLKKWIAVQKTIPLTDPAARKLCEEAISAAPYRNLLNGQPLSLMYPPSMGKSVPVMKAASSEQR